MALSHGNAAMAMNYGPLNVQILVSILNYAGTVIAESGATTDHTNRINLAYAVIRTPSTYAQMFQQYLVAQNLGTLSMDASGTTITVADAAVDGAVSAAWSSVADAMATTTL